MPRAFADEERELLKKKLRGVARQQIEERGVRAMAVADLTRAVGISKGAFYLLYESKDALVTEILGEVEVELRTQLTEVASDRDSTPTEVMTAIVRACFDVVGTHPVMALLADPEEGAYIFRMVTPEQLEERMVDDDRWFGDLTARLKSDGLLAVEIPDDILAAIARLALTVRRDPDLGRHPALVEVLCEALGSRLADGTR